jgi:hypothetical protein
MTWNQTVPSRLAALAALVLAVQALAGCGRPTGSVSGKVILKGQPLTAGDVTFIGADQRVASSPIQPDGSYAIPQVAAGKAQIGVTPPIKVTTGMPRGMKMDGGKMGAPGADTAAPPPASAGKPPAIPDQYLDPTKSGLTYEVKPGPQDYTIELK